MPLPRLATRLRPHLSAAPGLLVVGLLLIWAVHDGGYDAETWYWGALVTLGLLAMTLVALTGRARRFSRLAALTVVLLTLYVLWSYLSITWAQAPGTALEGSNRALLYLLVFALLLVVPWTPQAALVAVTGFAVGIGAIGTVLVVRLASDDRVAALIFQGRLAAPTGYFNATAALFMTGALVSVGLATRRELPGLLRGLLLALACTDLQLAVTVQSRGWLFTLPFVVIAAITVSTERLRLMTAAVLPIGGVLVLLQRLLDAYQVHASATHLDSASTRAGQAGLLVSGGVFVIGTLLAWGDSLRRERPPTRARRRWLGTVITIIAVGAVLAAGTAATHGHPVRFVVRQWNGFSKTQHGYTSSHFGDVGSGRYDFWRVSLDAALAHPIGGLGQDNFADYYVMRRHTSEEPSWTHSLEMRLIAHTGFVGLALFGAFLISAVALALRPRKGPSGLARGVSGIALLPLMVWLIHGSVDWFWEIPALSGPALGFLAMSGSLSMRPTTREAAKPIRSDLPGSRGAAFRRVARRLAIPAGVLGFGAALTVLAFSYLSVREVSLASDLRFTDPSAALSDLARAAKLDPLSSEPGRLGGTIALQDGQYAIAQRRFAQSVAREPGGWFSWFGAGLASSALGSAARAQQDFRVAYSINSKQKAVREALARVRTPHPLTTDQAFRLLILAN